MAVEEERLETAARNSAERKEGRRTNETPQRARGSAELGKVTSGSAAQCLWLRNGKVRSQVGGVDRSRFPGRGTVRRRASDRTKKRVYRI